MSKTAITVAILFLGTAFAAIPVLAPTTQPAESERNQSATVIAPNGTRAFDHLSMGPDPGGKTGDTVTTTTTTKGEPSTPNQSGPSSTAPSGATSTRTDPSTRPTTGSDASKQ
jgi:hypothetical protein